MKNASFNLRHGKGREPENTVVTTVVMASRSGLHIGILLTDGLHIFTPPTKLANMHLDSKELMNAVISSLQDCKVELEICGHRIPSSSLGAHNRRGREFISAKPTVESCDSYTIVQVFHQQRIQIENKGSLEVCFAFHVMTQCLGEAFIVQTTTRDEDEYIPMVGYQLANVSVLCHPYEVIVGLMCHVLPVRSSGMNSLAGLGPSVIMPTIENDMKMLSVTNEDARIEESITHSIPSKDFTQKELDDLMGWVCTLLEEDTITPDLVLHEHISPSLLDDWNNVGEGVSSSVEGATQYDRELEDLLSIEMSSLFPEIDDSHCYSLSEGPSPWVQYD